MSARIDTDETVAFELNGVTVNVEVASHTRLSDALRQQLNQNDVKIGCNAGDCGACSVLINDQCVCACLTSVRQASGTRVDTLRGLVANDAITKQLTDAFLHFGAAQCGICTPGMLVSATALLRDNPQPTESQVTDALGGVLCRCTGYRKIIDAIVNATTLSLPYAEVESTRASSPVATPPAENTISMAHTDGEVAPENIESSEAPAKIKDVVGGVGQPIVRLDGIEKVTGTDEFGDDVSPLSALHCVLIRSPYHHAEFELGNIEKFKHDNPGIVGVLSAKDIPGINRHGVIPPFIDQPVFAESITRFKGEVVAAVVGNAETVDSAVLRTFPVEWHERVPHLTPSEARAADATLVHPDRSDNILCRGKVLRGDTDVALQHSDVVVEGRYQTDFIEHAYIEPEAGYATRVGDRIQVYGCTQTPHMNRNSLAQILGIQNTDVRIVASSTGGGFGSKLDLSYQPYIALAAWKLNTAVRITFTRCESMQSTTKRHPANMRVRIGADKLGKLTALEFDGEFNTGAYASWGPTVANRVPVHASGPYYLPNYQANTVAVHTHTVPSGAFRGFGVPQAAIAQECLFDELADKLGKDRLEFRIDNALDNHQPTGTGQVFECSVGIKPCLQSLKGHWESRGLAVHQYNQDAITRNSPLRRGIGVASGWYGCGNTSLPNPSRIKAGIRSDGTVCLHQGAVDIGQGSNTVITQMFAQALGVSVGTVERIGSDTDITPDAGKTSASRQTFVSGNAAKLSGLALRAEILRLSNCQASSEIVIENSRITISDGNSPAQIVELNDLEVDQDGYVLSAAESYDPPIKPLDDNGQGHPYAIYGYAAHMVELEVDIELGLVKLRRFYAAHDVGKAINPNLIEGQIHGGVAQGIGLALMESFVPARTENLHDYLIPTFGDVPPINCIIVEVHDEHGPYGAKGLGEHVLIPTAPSILNAIRHASGAQIHHLPATPDRVLAAINAQRHESNAAFNQGSQV